MGRATMYAEDAILDAALTVVAESGAGASVTRIADELGAPSGSIYHRFPSRDLLFARLWIRTVQTFQRGFLEALSTPDSDEAARAAMLHTPRWSAQHPSEANLLLRFRRDDLVARWPDALGQDLVDVNLPVRVGLSAFVIDRYGVSSPEVLRSARFALIDIPYAAARSHIQQGTAASAEDEHLIMVAGMAVLRAVQPLRADLARPDARRR